MAQPDSTTEPKKGADGEKDLLKTAAKRWDAAYARERDNIEAAYTDLRLLADDPEAHWGPGVKEAREAEGRPCFTVNRLPQYIEQITGDQRQMRPSMRVVPVDSRADPAVAEKLGGLLRYIEHRSAAAAVYNRAAESQVSCGIGAWRVVTEYAADTTFEQEIGIRAVDDPIMVLFDPDATNLARDDAMFAFEPVDLSREAFEARFPGKTVTAFGEQNAHGFGSDWVGEDYVRVARYWWKEPVKKLLALLPDGGVDDLTDEKDPSKMSELKAAGARIERREAFVVKHALISCQDILEDEASWPGRYIPLVPVIGKEVRIGRRVVRKSAIRHARDPQRIYNYTTSAQIEVTALQPKAPFTGTEAMFENHAEIWERANTENRPYLPYTPDPMAPGQKPERVQPPVASQGIQAVLMQAGADIEGTIGIYKSSIGAASNETSGKAITARERQADTSTYVFIQNLAEAVAHTARIVLDLIPHVYDTQRQVRVIGLDGQEQLVTINKPSGLEMDGETPTENDVTVGAYDVVVESGPSYTTKKEEAREGIIALTQVVPGLAQAAPDLLAKAMEWPMADEIAERLRMMLPPPIQEALAQKEEEQNADDPLVAERRIAGRMQEAQAQIAQAEQQLMMERDRIQADLAMQKQAVELAKREVALQAKEAQASLASVAPQAAPEPAPAESLEAAVKEAEASLALQKEQAELDLAKQALALQQRELELRAKEIAQKEKMCQAQAEHHATVGAHHEQVAAHQANEAAAQSPALMQAVEQLPSIMVEAIAPTLQAQSAQIAKLSDTLGQLLAVAMAPTVVNRDPVTGAVLSATKSLNN